MRTLHRWTLGAAIWIANSLAWAQASSESTWAVDANAGVPRVRSSSDFNLIGDIAGGWATPSFGVFASGAAHTFALDRGDTHTDLDAYSASVEGYYRAGSETLRFELRAELGASLYDTTYIQVPATGVAFHDQTSVLYRGALLAGIAADPDPRWRLRALVGGGFQDEEYNALNTSSGGAGTTADIQDESRVSARGEARFQVHWLTFPDFGSFRLRSEAQLYTLTRSADVIAIIGGQVSTASSTDTLTQLETSTRLFFHFDVLKLVDLAPALFAGVDTLFVSAGGGAKSQVVPVIGLGILKDEF